MAEPRGTESTNPANPMVASRPQPEGRGDDHFAAPLGSSESGRLRFADGAHRIVIRADSGVRGLWRARFGERTPTVAAREGTVTIRHPNFPADEWLDCRSERPAEVVLNASIPWDVEVRGGASRLLADLRHLRLGSFRLDGGAGRLEVVLPRPVGTVAVIVLGGASNVSIGRPEGVAARLRVEGGATNLKFDDRRIGASGGELDLMSRAYGGATDRYDVTITGGANNLSIDERRGRSES